MHIWAYGHTPICKYADVYICIHIYIHMDVFNFHPCTHVRSLDIHSTHIFTHQPAYTRIFISHLCVCETHMTDFTCIRHMHLRKFWSMGLLQRVLLQQPLMQSLHLAVLNQCFESRFGIQFWLQCVVFQDSLLPCVAMTTLNVLKARLPSNPDESWHVRVYVTLVCVCIHGYIYVYTHAHACTHTCPWLQHNAIHRNTLQHAATHCNTLQNTASLKHCIIANLPSELKAARRPDARRPEGDVHDLHCNKAMCMTCTATHDAMCMTCTATHDASTLNTHTAGCNTYCKLLFCLTGPFKTKSKKSNDFKKSNEFNHEWIMRAHVRLSACVWERYPQHELEGGILSVQEPWDPRSLRLSTWVWMCACVWTCACVWMCACKCVCAWMRLFVSTYM